MALRKDAAGSGPLPVSLPLLLSPDSGSIGEGALMEGPAGGGSGKLAGELHQMASLESEEFDAGDGEGLDSGSEMDSEEDYFEDDLEDVPLVCDSEVGNKGGGIMAKVAGLQLGGGALGGELRLGGSGGEGGRLASPMMTTSVCVDLLSHAFRLRQETVRAAGEAGHGLRRLVSAGFRAALEVPEEALRFYEVRELAADEIGEGARHIAVGIDESSFTLTAIEDMLDKSKQARSTLDEYRQTIDEQARRIKRLEAQVAEQREKMRALEIERKAAVEEAQASRAMSSKTHSGLLTSTPSPRYLLDKGAGVHDTAASVPNSAASSSGLMERMRAPAAIEKLRSTLQRQTQLVSEIERCGTARG
eukprot:evm.model.scf_919EXC.4 EVM.evm.TU.scf_919EXC.4   scf_919EXC:54059-59193(-)